MSATDFERIISISNMYLMDYPQRCNITYVHERIPGAYIGEYESNESPLRSHCYVLGGPGDVQGNAKNDRDISSLRTSFRCEATFSISIPFWHAVCLFVPNYISKEQRNQKVASQRKDDLKDETSRSFSASKPTS